MQDAGKGYCSIRQPIRPHNKLHKSKASLNPVPPLTTGIIVVCIVLAVWSGFGSNLAPMKPLFLTEYFHDTGLHTALSGQFWRFLTPILLHFNVAHIVFNMIWMWQLGGPFERRLGTQELMIFVLTVGVFSNLAEYVYHPHYLFGGMSGVVYGLLGYFWIQGKFNPRFGMRLHKAIVVMMLAWFIICWLGWVGNIANMAHTIGLLLGMAWAYVSARLHHP